MKFADHLSREQKQQLNKIKSPKKKYPIKIQAVAATPVNEEQLSRIDWDEIMGTKRDTYKRVRGALRRR